MAFASTNFTTHGNSGRKGRSPNLHSYKTTDAATVVNTSGYFNAVYQQLDVGDSIMVAVLDGSGALVAAFTTIVRTISAAGVVDTVDATSFTVTNAG